MLLLQKFNLSVGLPVTLPYIGVDEITFEEAMEVTKLACIQGESIHFILFPIVVQDVETSIIVVNRVGKEIKAICTKTIYNRGADMEKKSIFLISHSKKITDGIKEMIEEMQSGEEVIIHSLGGTADDLLGSDPIKIMEAAKESRHVAAILVFADIGSATLSAEMVYDMLDEELQKKYHLVEASLVEGAFAAAITAGITDDVTQIIKEAEQAHVKGWG